MVGLVPQDNFSVQFNIPSCCGVSRVNITSKIFITIIPYLVFGVILFFSKRRKLNGLNTFVIGG